jgi:hypothetical protein
VFLAKDHRSGTAHLVFTWADPTLDGYGGTVVDGVSLDGYGLGVQSWPLGTEAPDPSVGRSPSDPKLYKVFKDRRDLQAAGYEFVEGTAIVCGSWKDYLRLHGAEDLPEEDWLEELDRYDEAARLRRRRGIEPKLPNSGNRDEVAAWVAKRHLIADAGIRAVLYCPREAPTDEIRLLELNDRVASAETNVEPIDFGLDVEGAEFRLLVADVTTDQFDRMKQDPSKLPVGWRLDGSRLWKRGA